MLRRSIITLALVLAVPAAAFGVSEVLSLDSKVESMKEAGVGPVNYPHAKHEKLYKCEDCHPAIFKEKRGASGITMKGNMDGAFCGSPNCHNSPKAFPLFMCQNCHTNVGGMD